MLTMQRDQLQSRGLNVGLGDIHDNWAFSICGWSLWEVDKNPSVIWQRKKNQGVWGKIDRKKKGAENGKVVEPDV